MMARVSSAGRLSRAGRSGLRARWTAHAVSGRVTSCTWSRWRWSIRPRPRSCPASASAALSMRWEGCPSIPESSLTVTGRLSTKQTDSRARARSSGSLPATQSGTRGRPISSSSRVKPSSPSSSPSRGRLASASAGSRPSSTVSMSSSAESSSPSTGSSSCSGSSVGGVGASPGTEPNVRSSVTRPHPDGTEGLGLVDHRQAALQQLEQGEEAGDRLQPGGHLGKDRLELHRSAAEELEKPCDLLLDREGDHPNRQWGRVLQALEHLPEGGRKAVRGDAEPFQREHLGGDQAQEAALARFGGLE